MAATMDIGGNVPGGLKVSGDKIPFPATLLLIVGEPFTVDQKDLILERIVSELYAWDLEAAKCDVEEQLGAFAQQQPRGQDGPNGEKIFELKSDVLRVTVLLNPRLQTVREKIHSFLLTPSHYRHLLHSGLALHGTGCWILQDGIFSFSCLSELFQRADVADTLGLESNGFLDVSMLAEGGDWNEGSLKKLAPRLKVRLNPPKSQRKEDGMVLFSDILSHSLKALPCVELLQASDVVGNISFQRPTIYIFPAGKGDSALFGVSGFNLLVDGGYSRRSCFWQFIRHLLRIDAIIVSHIAPDNIFGVSSFFERKATERTSPDLGVVYLNIGETKPLAPNGALPVSTGLVVSLADEGAGIVDHLQHIGMTVSPCAGSPPGQPLKSFNLYFKVGHGSLDVYVLNPLNGKDLSNFLSSWAKNINSTKSGLPLADEQSVCSLLVWKPASPKEKVVRILFPGNAPQSKIFEGIERLKNVAIFQSTSGIVEKPAAHGKVPERKAAPVAGKPPVNKQMAPLTSDAEPKKPAGNIAEQKPTGEHKETKRPADHKEVKKTVDHKPSVKAETETKKADGKQGPERKEMKKISGVESKKTAVAPATAAAAAGLSAVEGKASAAKHQDSTPGKQAKVPEKAAKDAKNKKVAKETQEVRTPGKKTPGPKDHAGPTTPATPSGKADKAQKKEETAAKSEGQKKERAAGNTAMPAAVMEAVKEPVSKPIVAESVVKEPVVAEPVFAEPVTSEPFVKEPVVAEPVVAEPVTSKPFVKEPVVTEPVVAEPVTSKPFVKEPVVAEPVVAKPVVAEPVTSKPFVKEPIVTEPVVAEPVTSKPFVKEPVVAEPLVAEPVTILPVAAENSAVEPLRAEPLTSEPAITEPMTSESFATAPVTEEEPLSDKAKELESATKVEKVADICHGESKFLTKEKISGEKEHDLGEQLEEKELEEEKELDLGEKLEEKELDLGEKLEEKKLDFGEKLGEKLGEKELDFGEKLVISGEEDMVKEESDELEKLVDTEEVRALSERNLHAEHESLKASDEKIKQTEELESEVLRGLESSGVIADKTAEEVLPASYAQNEELEIKEKVESAEAEKSTSFGEDRFAISSEQFQPVPEELESDPRNVEVEEGLEQVEKQFPHAVQNLRDIQESAADFEAELDLPADDDFSPVEKELAETPEKLENMRRETNVPTEDFSTAAEKEFLETPEKLVSPKSFADESHSVYIEKDLVEMLEKGIEIREGFSTGDPSAPSRKELPLVHGLAEGDEDESSTVHPPKQECVFVEEADGDDLLDREEHPLEETNQGESEASISQKAVDEALFDLEKQWGPPEGLPAPVNGKEGGTGKKGDQSLLQNTSVSGPKKSAPAQQLNASVMHGKKNDGKDAASKSKRPSTAPDDSAKDKKVAEDAAKSARGAASAGPSKKAASTSKPHVKESSAKTSHGLDSKKTASKPVVPLFVDLTYIPSHGDLRRLDVDFFRAVRARYYVISTPEPDPRVLSLLLDGKQSWENAEVVTIIPTYDSTALTSWATENQNRLKKLNVEIAPSASRCTMQLQEREASCMAYRLEF